MRYRLLGQLEVIGDDGQLISLAASKERTVLAALLLSANRAVSPARLIDAMWGEAPPAAAVNALQVQISRLRKKLSVHTDRDLLLTAPSGYRLRVDPGELDVERFEGLARFEWEEDPADTSTRLAEALALWRGPALADVESDLLRADAVRLDELRLVTIEKRVDAELARGGHHRVIPDLAGLVAQHPLREGLRLRLMLALYRCGRQADALAVFDDLRKRLIDQLGLDPSPALKALEAAVLTQSPELDLPSVAPGSRLTEGTEAATPTNLRLELSSFVGRQDDLAGVARTLRECRLVTVSGSGGVGKTRLACRVATAALRDFPDGVWLVELGALSDPSLVVNAVAAVLGAPDQGDDPVLDRLVARLRGRTVMLVLDNCEHLIDACAALVEHLLSSCGSLRVLATSREPLNIPAEALWRLRSLQVPNEGMGLRELTATEAVTLFCHRAHAVSPGFEISQTNGHLVGAICRRLDGIPLAIELAASRTRTLTSEVLAASLENRFRVLTGGYRTAPPRQRTLAATIRWSYDLLSEPERRLFDRLSVFAGGCTLHAAVQVCSDPPLHPDDVPDLLARLVDRSMVTADDVSSCEGRYRLLDSLRAFGSDRLVEGGEADAVRDRHLRWAVDLVEALPLTTGSADSEVFVIEEHNLRAAVRRAMDANHDEDALRILGSAWFGHFNERLGTLRILLPPGPDVPADVAAKALWDGVALATMMGDWELTARWAESGEEAARAAEDPLLLSLFLNYHGMSLWGLGHKERTRPFLIEGLAVAQDAGSTTAEIRSLIGLAWLQSEDDLAEAQAAAERALVLSDDMFSRAHAEEVLAFVHFLRKDLRRACLQLADAARSFASVQRNCAAHILETCAAWAAANGSLVFGAELLGAAERIRDETGDRPRVWEQVVRNDWLPLLSTGLDTGEFDRARRRGRDMSFPSALHFAEANLRAAAGAP